MYAIEAKNLSKTYLPPGRLGRLIMRSPIKEPVRAVQNIALAVDQGELFGLIGPNGAGKTTFVKMLCTLLRPTSGWARVNGFDVVLDEEKVKASIGYVSGEERSFYWRLTGRQNLMFFASLYNLSGREAEERIDGLLDRLDLSESADNMVYSYSSGMKQKLAFARGLLADPAVLFLDEPTKSVDAITARSIMTMITDELVGKEGRTVFLTSHRLEEVETMCDRFAIINRGEISFSGTLADLSLVVSKEESNSSVEQSLADLFFAYIGQRSKNEP